MRGASLVAQAKINLFLHVLGKEESGYHSLETLFQRLELGDQVRLWVDVQGRSLDCRGADVGPVERNLAWRAAVAYADATGWPATFSIEVEKLIPAGGGLGGGSADAAAVLRLLNHMAPSPIDEWALLGLAIQLGADVPFLTTTSPLSLAWGRGERLLALPPLPPAPVALLLPGTGVATADAFRWLATDRASQGTRPPEPRELRLADLGAWPEVARLARNDLEEAVASRTPVVASLRSLRAELDSEPGGIYQMTGSGSTWFALGAAARRVGMDASSGAGSTAGVRLVHTATTTSVVEPVRLE